MTTCVHARSITNRLVDCESSGDATSGNEQRIFSEAADAATNERRRVEGDWLYDAGGQSRRLAETLDGDALAKHLQDLCAWAWGGSWGAWSTKGAISPKSVRSRFRRWRPICRTGSPRRFSSGMDSTNSGSLSPRQLETSGRLVTPLFAGPEDSGYRVIEWDEALERLADRLKAAGPTRSFFYASGRSSNEAGFLLQLLARLFGTNYVNNCSYYCHQASGVGLGSSIGVGTGTIQLEDLDHTDLYILIGANPASNHPRLMRSLMQLRRRGGEVIVINPAKELGLVNFRVPSDVRSLLFGTQIASQYVQPHIGGDIALLTGVAKEVLAARRTRSEFIDESHRRVRRNSRNRLNETSWDAIDRDAGVTPRRDSPNRRAYSSRRKTSSSAGRWASRIIGMVATTCA